MKYTSGALAILAAVCLLTSCASPDRPEARPAADVWETDTAPDTPAPTETPMRSSREIIRDMVYAYSSYGPEADGDIQVLLEELGSVDQDAAARWKRIMATWKSIDADLLIQYDVLPDGLPDTDELCIVALGFQLNPDGTMRRELTERLKVVKNSAEKYPNAWIVCTGGGTAAKDPSATEAGRMAAWLIRHGIDKSRILVEDRSMTTAENAIFTYALLSQAAPQVTKLAIISSDYHIATGTLLFDAEAILQAGNPGEQTLNVVANAAWAAPSGALSARFQAGALMELF